MRYRVKVTEKHCDYVWVDAESEEKAKAIAPKHAFCEYECLYDCEIAGYEENLSAPPQGN